MAEPREESSDGMIDLGGARTIRTAGQSHSLLLEALHAASAISVDCSQVAEADLSLVQFLLSARKSAARSGKSLTLAHPAQGALRDILMRGGFLEADSLAGDRAFWLMSEAFDEDRS